MSVQQKPTPREIALRLIASYHGGSKNPIDVLRELTLTVDDLAAIVTEFVQIAGAVIGLLSEEREQPHDEVLDAIERAMDRLERGDP